MSGCGEMVKAIGWSMRLCESFIYHKIKGLQDLRILITVVMECEEINLDNPHALGFERRWRTPAIFLEH